MSEDLVAINVTSDATQDVTSADDAQTHQKILTLQHAMQQLEPLEIPLKHYHAHLVYAREMTVPAGALVVGKTHRFNNLNIISQGSGFVVSRFGKEYFTAPYTFVAPAGSKRAIHALTDVVWTTIVNNFNHTNPDEIENAVIQPDDPCTEVHDRDLQELLSCLS